MSCCAPGIEAANELAEKGQSKIDNESLIAGSIDLKDGRRQLELAVPDVHCAACMRSIESELSKLEPVELGRVNLSTKRVKVIWRTQTDFAPTELVNAVNRAGYRAMLLEAEDENAKDKTFSQLVRALAVAGFAAMNIMLFSISIWSGADASTRDLFHWISALIAIPAVAFAGQHFFRSAFASLKVGRLNMDVPISLAVILALGLSVFETANSGEHAYFDASVTLLFFLLIGRTLDHLMRERARSAVRNLASLAPRGALQRLDDGRHSFIKLNQIEVGMRLDIAAGERIPVDGFVVQGNGEIDLSLVTGESAPEPVSKGHLLLAGATNLSGMITMQVTKPAHESFLARMVSMMEAAEGSRAGYKRIADRAAEIYAPVVHLLALATFLGWGLYNGDWHHALVTAIAVLIITCPCALALAVPIVHVVAAGRLFERGMMMRDGAALERLAKIDYAAFDKTGTLSQGKPEFVSQTEGGTPELEMAVRLARLSHHPFSKALAQAHKSITVIEFDQVDELPGQGIEARFGGDVWRLGRAAFCAAQDEGDEGLSRVYLAKNGVPVGVFEFEDQLRPEVPAMIERLRAQVKGISLLSGDRKAPVQLVAKQLGLNQVQWGLTPQEKLDQLTALEKAHNRVLMVGDGINDAPSLRAAYVSMAPSSAADVGRNAADFVLTRDRLDQIPFALTLAKRAANAVKQNFGLAIAYNMVAIPLAIMGFATPLVASIAMSTSSVLVTLNALRLRIDAKERKVQIPLSTNQKVMPAE
ncbi:cation-translocating P-type ATPase [Maritalea porphyrae]|uniref:cation-translocating P-type ATPase n=1 Tax=Maritalea porphyrae TaxID=880732 RepID=UPI0022AED6C5|nr:cation-translocating P-type ATPase [Maritalea porphyrae]MCZ4272361.1 cation-translocating P-type ATPase [Maritalea porphyrae]